MKLTEKHVQDAVVQFLELDGWRAIRTDPVSDRTRGKGFGELGMADYLFLRYWQAVDNPPWLRSTCSHLWIEFKSSTGKLAKHQAAWHAAETARGALVLTVNSIHDFRKWYMESGLAWRVR